MFGIEIGVCYSSFIDIKNSASWFMGEQLIALQFNDAVILQI